MTCIKREIDDLDDVGLENLSDVIKELAMRAAETLTKVGILHIGIELRTHCQK